jgi:pimeloyl-ACP methyl ester carboxylesterase
MNRRAGLFFGLLGVACMSLAGGCATAVVGANRSNVVMVVPGVGGDGAAYAQVVHSLEVHGSGDCLCVSDWGSTWPVFFISVSSEGWHRDAEMHLAEQITQWREKHPGARIVLIAHSAGAGVTLGAVARLGAGVVVGPVILLAPDLSPGFDLRPALQHVDVIHVFYSSKDAFFQGIGPEIVGTYDRVHCDGAGLRGFTLANLSAPEKGRVIQHAYRSEWEKLGNDGGHYDWLAEGFVAEVIEPIIDDCKSRGQFAGFQGEGEEIHFYR